MRSEKARKYRQIATDPTHPLAGSGGRVSEARRVLYAKIGPGPHSCHWCSRQIDWLVGAKGNVPNAVIADHIDNDPLNDSPDNVVPACGTCNGTRTQAVRDDEVYVTRGHIRCRAVRRSCEFCSQGFLAVPAALRQGRGRFCSRSCARRGAWASRRQ